MVSQLCPYPNCAGCLSAKCMLPARKETTPPAMQSPSPLQQRLDLRDWPSLDGCQAWRLAWAS